MVFKDHCQSPLCPERGVQLKPTDQFDPLGKELLYSPHSINFQFTCHWIAFKVVFQSSNAGLGPHTSLLRQAENRRLRHEQGC